MLRLQQHYEQIIRPDMLYKYQYTNSHQIPSIQKVVLNMSIKDVVQDKKQILPGLLILEYITGQKAMAVKAKKSISNFKLRQGVPIGIKVTLRNKMLYRFLELLIFVALPRMRDLKPIKINNNCQTGHISFGLRDLLIFPQIESEYDRFSKVYGLNITIVTNAKTIQESKSLLSSFQLPIV
jgi:large subunit ribosomal protein L5